MSRGASREPVHIIGAGIIGLACAHYLNEAGFEVTLLDKAGVGEGCSKGNCGHILPSHILPLNSPDALKTGFKSLLDPSSPFRIKPRLAPAFLRWLLGFARLCRETHILHAATHLKPLLDSSFAEYERLTADPEFDCEWSHNGLLYLFRQDRSLAEFARTDHWLNEHFGLTATRLDGNDIAKLDPAFTEGLAGGFHYEQDAHLRPEALIRAWTAKLRAAGVTFKPFTEVRAIERADNRLTRLRTSEGEISPEHVVLAAGAYSGPLSQLLGAALPVEPGKGYALTVAHPSPSPRLPFVMPEQNIAVTPFAEGLRVGSMMEFVGFDESAPPRRFQQLRDGVAPYLRAPLPSAHQEQWFGWRPMTYDSLPIIGQLASFSNVYAATGHQMIGVMSAPATGKLLADLLTGRDPHIPAEAFSPNRF